MADKVTTGAENPSNEEIESSEAIDDLSVPSALRIFATISPYSFVVVSSNDPPSAALDGIFTAKQLRAVAYLLERAPDLVSDEPR